MSPLLLLACAVLAIRPVAAGVGCTFNTMWIKPCATNDLVISGMVLARASSSQADELSHLQLKSAWEIISSYRAFTQGPFGKSPPALHVVWGPPLLKGGKVWGARTSWEEIVDVGVYSLVLLACDALLTVAWHIATRKLISRSNPAYRIRSLSPSVRFSIGFLFGVARLWVISHISPTPLYFLISRWSFALGLALGLAALVFDDGPWRSLRPHNHSAVDHMSPLNPMRLLKPDFIADARPGKWRVTGLKRRLESHPGRPVALLLDARGEIVLTESGRIQVRIAADLLQNAPERRLVELIATTARCRSGNMCVVRWRQPFARAVEGTLFRRRLNPAQRKALCELLCELNGVGTGTTTTSGGKTGDRSREGSSGVTSPVVSESEEEEEEDDGGMRGRRRSVKSGPLLGFNLAMFRTSTFDDDEPRDDEEGDEEDDDDDDCETEDEEKSRPASTTSHVRGEAISGILSHDVGDAMSPRLPRRRHHLRNPDEEMDGFFMGKAGHSPPSFSFPASTLKARRRSRADSPSSIAGLDEFLTL